ncbi:MAG: FAD-dependent oxidoreductase, partial [Flavobacteriaceae bacterium]
MIGIIGSGIAGLSAALRLRSLGYEVTVFEAHTG